MTKIFGIETSKIQGTKKTISSLSLILILAVSMIMAFAQPTLAQIGVPMPEKTTGYIDVAPRLLGVGQEATVNLFIYPIPTNYKYNPYFLGYFGVTVTFVKPDGTKDTFMPVDGTHQYAPGQTQSLGAIFFFYKPDMAGNWSVSFTMPAQNITDTTGTAPFGSVLMQGCTSKSTSFTVQTDPVLAGLLNGYPWSPLPNPNVFWSYPINANNREWNQISGDWLGSAIQLFTVNSATQLRWQPYGSGPNTGHIVWKQPFRDGGIMGGDYGSTAYGAQGSVISSVIMGGKLFINIPNTTPFGQSVGQFRCWDLATGQVLYTANGTITAGLHYPGNAYSQSTATNLVLLESSFGSDRTPYLYGTVTVSGVQYWNYYDPRTGTLLRSLTNCSSARLIDGSMLAYGTASGNVFRWNFSKVPTTGSTANNWTAGIEWTKPLPTSLMGTQPSIFGVTTDASTLVLRVVNGYWGYSTENGASLWNLTLNYAVTANEAFCTARGDDSIVIIDPTESTFKCYSMKTGALKWTSTSFNDAVWATTWTVYWSETNDLENLYAIFSDGTMRAFSLKDGHEVWRSKAVPSTEYPNNVVPYVCSVIMVDGKLYGFAGYSSQYKINPISRHAMLMCIDATNGDTIFALNGGIRPSAAANGYVIGTGDLDGILYCLGKGKTSTAVTAQQQVGGSVLIQGSVLDQSAAQPNTPAISDADMGVWMDYLHMQNATLLNDPPNCIGVPVTLSAVSSSGTSVNLGTVTSDVAGHFAYQWSPTTEGLYTVYATFAGTNSYFSSYGETSATVAIAATPETPASPVTGLATTSDLLSYVAVATVVIIIAIAIVGVLLLRKHA